MMTELIRLLMIHKGDTAHTYKITTLLSSLTDSRYMTTTKQLKKSCLVELTTIFKIHAAILHFTHMLEEYIHLNLDTYLILRVVITNMEKICFYTTICSIHSKFV